MNPEFTAPHIGVIPKREPPHLYVVRLADNRRQKLKKKLTSAAIGMPTGLLERLIRERDKKPQEKFW